MSQITGPISINNGAATPVAKSFAPERVGPELSVFTERSAAVSAGFCRISAGFSSANAKRPTNRIDVDLSLPVLSTVNGVSSVAYIGRFRGYFVVPDQMTSSERADLHAYTSNFLATAQVKGMVKDLDPMY